MTRPGQSHVLGMQTHLHQQQGPKYLSFHLLPPTRHSIRELESAAQSALNSSPSDLGYRLPRWHLNCCLKSLDFLVFKIYLFIYLLIFHMLVHSANGHNRQGSDRLKSGTQRFIWASYLSFENSGLGAGTVA